jgi:hypothetical protein
MFWPLAVDPKRTNILKVAMSVKIRVRSTIRLSVLASSLGRVADLRCAGPTTEDGLPNLIALPGWARFVSLVATRVATAAGNPLTTAISLPTRAWAAAIALGTAVVDADALMPSIARDLESHLTLVRDWPEGVPIKYFEPPRDGSQKVHQATWLGIGPPKYPSKQIAERERLRFELRKGGVREVLLKEGMRLQLDLAATQGGLAAAALKVSPLVMSTLGEAAAAAYATANRCDVIAVATMSVIAEELQADAFCAHDEAGAHGPLQELARAAGLSAQGSGRRSRLVPSSSKLTSDAKALRPRVVVYDGGRAYLRGRDEWPEANKLVLLDRSAPSAEDAAAELSAAAAYADRDDDVLGGLTAPEGVEVFSFRSEP